MSQIFKQLIHVFWSDGGYNFATGGIKLPNGKRFFAKLGFIIQDGDAHVHTWSIRGNKGSNVCLLCENISIEESEIDAADGSKMLTCNVICDTDLQPADDVTLRANLRYLEGQRHSADFAQLQQSLGMTWQPHALLLDATLDGIVYPTTQYMHDWMHTLIANGIVNLAIYLLFETFIEAGSTRIYEVCEGFIAKWKWPSRLHGDHLSDIFTNSKKKSHRDAKHVKCQASDLLSLYPVLAYFVQIILLKTCRDDSCTNACKAFLALVKVLEFIHLANRAQGRITSDMMRDAIHEFLTAFVLAWGVSKLIPKCHWLLHFAKHFQTHGALPSCFVNERYHRNPKRYANDMTNTNNDASTNVLKETVCHMISRVENPFAFAFNIGLVNGRPASRSVLRAVALLLDAETVNSELVRSSTENLFSNFGTCCKGGIVLVKSADSSFVGRVRLHVELDGEPYSAIEIMSLLEHDAAANYSEWSSDNAQVVLTETDHIMDTLIYTITSSGVGVLMPCDQQKKQNDKKNQSPTMLSDSHSFKYKCSRKSCIMKEENPACKI